MIPCPVSLEKMAISIWMRSLVDLLSGDASLDDEIYQETVAECLRRILQEDEMLSANNSLVQVILIPKLEDYRRGKDLPSKTQVSG
jgi:hypothetical protein